MWRQKSREVRLKEGNRNTRFFQKMTNTYKRHNDIVSLKINWVKSRLEKIQRDFLWGVALKPGKFI